MKLLVGIFLILCVLSCNRSELIPNGCGVRNPMKELPWLASMAEKPTIDIAISQATYQSQTVYMVSSCGRCFAGSNVAVYQCDGTVLCNGLLLYGNPAPACKSILDALTDSRVLFEKK